MIVCMARVWSPVVDELQAAAGLVPRPLRILSGLLSGLVFVIWALTSHHTFWPMWVWFGLATPLSLIVTIRRVHPRSGSTPQRVLTDLWAVLVLTVAWQIVIWLMTGAGYFWPVWNLLLVAVIYTVRRFFWRPGERRLEQRVDELSRTRRGALDVQATELRRIERNLHDGAQARLVALSMQLGRAEERLHGDPDAQRLVAQARHEATAAIGELRDLARGIAPPVLADRGLEAAVQSLADRSGQSVTVNAELPQRLPPSVETAAYFVVAETLTNAVKHARAASVRVTMWAEHGELGIVVADDGVGGADALGSGLTGLRQRVEALDGWLRVESQTGEGTTVRAGMPCES
jgi:signal transduction histidine kinase